MRRLEGESRGAGGRGGAQRFPSEGGGDVRRVMGREPLPHRERGSLPAIPPAARDGPPVPHHPGPGRGGLPFRWRRFREGAEVGSKAGAKGFFPPRSGAAPGSPPFRTERAGAGRSDQVSERRRNPGRAGAA